MHQRNSGSHMKRKRYAWLRRRGRNSRKTRVTPCRRPSVRRAARNWSGKDGGGSLARLACPMPPPSPFLFLPLVAIVILIRHSNNDSLAANWPKERSGERGGRGRLIVRYGWNGYVPPPSPPSLLCVGIEWMSRGGEIRAGRPRAHARIYRFDSSDHRSS